MRDVYTKGVKVCRRHIADFYDVRNLSYVGERFQIAKDSLDCDTTVTFARKDTIHR